MKGSPLEQSTAVDSQSLINRKFTNLQNHMEWCRHDRITRSQRVSCWVWKQHLGIPVYRIPPQSLRWNLKMMVSKRNVLFQGGIFRFIHVDLVSEQRQNEAKIFPAWADDYPELVQLQPGNHATSPFLQLPQKWRLHTSWYGVIDHHCHHCHQPQRPFGRT